MTDTGPDDDFFAAAEAQFGRRPYRTESLARFFDGINEDLVECLEMAQEFSGQMPTAADIRSTFGAMLAAELVATDDLKIDDTLAISGLVAAFDRDVVGAGHIMPHAVLPEGLTLTGELVGFAVGEIPNWQALHRAREEVLRGAVTIDLHSDGAPGVFCILRDCYVEGVDIEPEPTGMGQILVPINYMDTQIDRRIYQD